MDCIGVSVLTFYSFLSSVLSYVFTFIIYLFIFGVIRLIYLDVKKMSRFETNHVEDEECAALRPVKSKVQVSSMLKRRYNIYGSAVLGRNKTCDIVIKEQFISGEHLRIWYEDGDWVLEDLGSRNGTFVNGMRIREPVIIESQDEISAGGLNFVFEL